MSDLQAFATDVRQKKGDGAEIRGKLNAHDGSITLYASTNTGG